MEEEINNTIKLPVIAVLKDAFDLLLQNIQKLTKSLLVTFVIILSISILSEKVFVESGFVTMTILYILSTFAFTLFAITCHRTFLLGGEIVPKFGEFQWASREWRFLWWTLVAYYFMMLVMVLLAAPLAYFAYPLSAIFGLKATQFLQLFALLPAFYVFSRVSILFPATAVEKKIKLGLGF